MENLKTERVAKNTGFLFIRMLLIMGIGLFTSREVLRILGVQNFGIYNLVGTLVTMFVFFQMALTNATSRFITFDIGTGKIENIRKTFSMSMNCELIVFILIFLLSEAVGPWFINNKLQIPEGRIFAAQIVYQISLLNFLFGLLLTPFSSLIIAHEHMGFYSYTSVFESVFKLLSVWYLLIIPYDKLIFYAIFQMLTALILFVWNVWYCKQHFKEVKYIKCWDGELFKKIANYSGLSLLLNMIDIAVGQCISIFFNVFQGVVANAALAVANTVNNHISNFLNNFTKSYNPQIIKSYAEKQYDYFMKIIFSSSKFSFFLFFGVAFPIVLNIDYILNLWLDNVPYQTGIFVLFIVITNMWDSFSWPLMCAVHATGNLKIHQPMIGIIKLFNIPISYLLLVNGFPAYFILVVYAFLNLVCAIARIIYLHYLIKLNLAKYVRQVLVPMLLVVFFSIPLPILSKFYISSNCLSFVVSCISFMLVFILSIRFFALQKREKEIIYDMARKVRNKIWKY